uniref:Uncharacterized protein n=1 Tax=Magallana gigas TaxID=29159 RepID=K1PSR9_MAGGI
MADYDVSVRLLEYTRDQDCSCDGGFWGCGECDVYFQICLQPLSPTQGQICQGNNQDYRVDDTHHFLAGALRGHDKYTWRNVNGQPSFQISVDVFDYDYVGGTDDLGVTSYTYRGNRPTVQTVTTTPGNKNMSHNTSTKNNDSKHSFNSEKIIFNNTSKNNNNFSPYYSIFLYGQSSTKIQIVYNCTQCNHTDDWITDKVRSALQILNFTLYQEKTIGKNTIANFKINTGLVVGVVVSLLLIIVIVIGAVCWYKSSKNQLEKPKPHSAAETYSSDAAFKPVSSICAKNFYGQNCSVHCISSGNLTCNDAGYGGEDCNVVVTSSTSPQTTTEAPTSYTSTAGTIKALSTKHHRTVTSDQTTERELTTVVKTANTVVNPRTKTTKDVRTSQSTQSFTKHQSSFSYISAKSSKSTHNIKSTTTDRKRSSKSSFHTPVETSRSKQGITSATTHRLVSSQAVITNGQNTPGTSTKVNLSAPRQKVVTDKNWVNRYMPAVCGSLGAVALLLFIVLGAILRKNQLRNRSIREKTRIIVGNTTGYPDDLGLSVIDLDEATFDNPTYGTSDPLSFIQREKSNQSKASLQICDTKSVESMEV